MTGPDWEAVAAAVAAACLESRADYEKRLRPVSVVEETNP